MPFVFTPPTMSTRHENPADMLLRTFRTGRIELIMGVTRPTFSGHVIDSPQCPAKINLLPVTAAGGGGFECVPRVLNQEFSWEMELPPDPPWRSQQANPADIERLCAFLDRSHAKQLSGGIDFSQVTRIEVRPVPNWPVIREHTYSHEMQHVCDFKWAARQLFGPVVEMIDHYAQANIRVHCESEEILAFFAGGNEAITIAKYLDATDLMGRKYHATASGGPPVPTFTGLAPNGHRAYIDLTFTHGTFPVSFYTGRPHQYYRVTSVGVRDEVQGFDPPARHTHAFTQDAVDAMAGGGNDDAIEDDDFSGGSAQNSDSEGW